jgi:hypothetical protein
MKEPYIEEERDPKWKQRVKATEGTKERGIIMGREISQTEIKGFIASTGLDIDPLDERDETLETWRLKWEGLAKGFMDYLQDRFTAIEHRLERLEEERYGCHKNGI